MGKLIVFNSVSLDGFFVDMKGDMSWAHNSIVDKEWDAFVEGNASGGGVLVFGRITYELMNSYWPTPMAARNDPVVSERMNNLQKVVFSRTMDRATWANTRLVKDGMTAEIRKMKNDPTSGMAIMGSGTIVSQLTQERMIDEYQIVVVPIILGKGRTMFEGVEDRLNLKQISSRSFANGNVFLVYEPVR
jgi:dihydrofolate reductase